MDLMNYLSIIGIAYFVIEFWLYYAYEFKVFRPIIDRLNFKPFNCDFCLYSWTGLILSVVFLNPAFMLLLLLRNI